MHLQQRKVPSTHKNNKHNVNWQIFAAKNFCSSVKTTKINTQNIFNTCTCSKQLNASQIIADHNKYFNTEVLCTNILTQKYPKLQYQSQVALP